MITYVTVRGIIIDKPESNEALSPAERIGRKFRLLKTLGNRFMRTRDRAYTSFPLFALFTHGE